MLIDSRGKRVQLGDEIGRGFEATVHNVRGRTDRVAKIYQPGRGYPAAKLAAMLAITDQALHNLCAWPTDVVLNSGTFVGFLMPKIADRRPVFDLYVPKLRLQHFPSANWRFLVHAAENTARAVHHIHQACAVIGDVNHSNLMVANDATVRVIDTDSFQITAGNQRWPCRVGTGDYQPPEMQQLTSYDGIVRTPNHDLFGLAVLIFKLLFAGRHPFSGRWKGQGDAPAIEDAIKASRYAYSQRRSTGMQPPGDALSVDALPADIRDLFEQAFDPVTTKAGRPTAEQWMTALQALGRTVRQCRINRFHWFYSGATRCPWCEIEQQSGAVMFGATTAPQPTAPQPSQASQVARPPPAPAPPTVPVLLSRQTPGQLFAWARAHRKGIAWASAVVLVVWLASRQDTTPPPHPAPPGVTTPTPAPTSRSPSPPLTTSSPPASRSVEASTPAPVQQPRPAPPPAYQPPPLTLLTPPAPPAPTPIPQLPTISVTPAPPSVPLPTPAWPPQAITPSTQPPTSIGPSYDCAKAQTPLQTLICSDAVLSRTDLELVQPYYVLRQLVGKDGWKDLLYEAIDFQNQTAYDCKIDDAGVLPTDLLRLKACLTAAYEAQRHVWLQKLQGPGREEAQRPIEQHIALQARLQALGYLPATASIDGVYGVATRAAIVAWQTTAQLPITGLLGDSDALRLR
jgi:uncharacterized protein/serine/threonine protein kinase